MRGVALLSVPVSMLDLGNRQYLRPKEWALLQEFWRTPWQVTLPEEDRGTSVHGCYMMNGRLRVDRTFGGVLNYIENWFNGWRPELPPPVRQYPTRYLLGHLLWSIIDCELFLSSVLSPGEIHIGENLSDIRVRRSFNPGLQRILQLAEVLVHSSREEFDAAEW